jgi:hypothetical protein
MAMVVVSMAQLRQHFLSSHCLASQSGAVIWQGRLCVERDVTPSAHVAYRIACCCCCCCGVAMVSTLPLQVMAMIPGFDSSMFGGQGNDKNSQVRG